MRKKFFYIIILLVISINSKVHAVELNSELIEEQKQIFGINDFIEEAEEYSGDFYEDINVSELISSAISGKIDNRTLLKKVINVLGIEIKEATKTLIGVLVIVLIHSLLKVLTEDLRGSNISQIIYYVQYILIVSLVMNNFSDIINIITDTVNNLVGFMNSLISLLITLMIYTGSITTTTLLEPVILFLIEFIGNIVVTLIIPTVSIITALIIVSKITDRVQINKLASFMKSSVIWFLGLILTIFVGVLSLEGTLTSSIDGITAKTAKAAVSSLIPVVGKVLGDSIDSVLGCGLVIKNAVGVVGIIIIIGICLIPIIKLATLSIMYTIASAIIEPLADTKIVKLLDELGGIFKLLLAIICSVSVLLIVGITIVIKVSNSGMMYR